MENQFFIPLFLFAWVTLFSCTENKTDTNVKSDSAVATDSIQQKDTVPVASSDSLADSIQVNRSDWKIDDYIIEYPGSQKSELQGLIKDVISGWQNTPNPIIATYQGNNFGDYFHVIFEDATGNTYDFGHGNNEFGEFQLFKESGQYEDDPRFLKKKFKVYWDWKESEFPCCDGEYDKAKAFLPSIVRLELITD